jgi:putative acetyltransferase
MNPSFPGTLVIRTAEPDDLIQMLRIQIDALRSLCIHDYSPEQIEDLIQHNIHHASHGGPTQELTIVGEVDQVIVGLASLWGSAISAMYVHPQLARQGIGSQLLQALEQRAIVRHIQTLRGAASLTARPFYQANGYQVTGTSSLATEGRKQSQRRPIQVVKMQKHLLVAPH